MNFFFFLILSTAFCSAATDPSAEKLLQAARINPTAHPVTLSGKIRGAKQPLPLTLKIGTGKIEYQFQNPEEHITLQLAPSTSTLSVTRGGTTEPIGEERRYEEIRDTGVTYDDLSLGFLYWPNPRMLTTETLRGEKVALLELTAPTTHSTTAAPIATPYSSARIWIDEANGAPLRMEGFDKNGQLLKRFEVISAQKIDNLWTLKEMRIETFSPTTHAVIQRRYLDVGH